MIQTWLFAQKNLDFLPWNELKYKYRLPGKSPENKKERRIIMKKLKRVLALLVALTMLMALAACGGGNSGGNTGADSGSSAGSNDANTPDDAGGDAGSDDSSSGGSGDVINVGFAQVGHESDWRTASTKSAQDVFSAENGYNLNFVDCDNDSAAQLEAIRTFIQQEVDYIIVDPIVSTGWDTILTECDEAGIPVIVIDRTIEDSDKYVSWVGSDFKIEGLACGEWLKAYAAAKGISEINALVIEGSVGASATIGRTEGFKEIADREGWNILASQSGDFTEAGGQEVMESFCQSYKGQFNVVICQNDNEASGAMTAMDTAGISYGVGGDVIIVSFDANKPYVQMVCDGKLNANFECNPLAAPTVANIIATIESGGTPEKEVFVTESWFAAEDNVPTITVNGEEQQVIHATQEVVDARPY